MELGKIFNFFKKKKQELDEVVEKISFEDIDNFLKEKKKGIKNNQKQPLNQIKESLLELLNELDDKIIILKNLNLDEKKAPERAKLIVKENFDKFIYYLDGLILDLKEIGSDPSLELEILINKINSTFSEFEKKSLMSFQKSTFLIGKELGDVSESIARFFKSFKKIIKENDYSIDISKTISTIEEKLIEVNGLEKTESENIEVTKGIEEKIMNLENEIEKLKKEIEEKKQSTEYIEQTKIKNKLETTKTKLIIELQSLREIIDFKALAKVYHSIEGKINLIKEYKENFKDTFEKYGSENLIELVDIKEINKELVKEKVKNINEIKQEIENTNLKEDLTKDLEKEINNLREKIKEFNLETSSKQKRDKKLKENKKQIKQEVINLLETIDVEVI